MSQHAEMGSAPTTSAIACSAAAERMRAHRRRRRAGLRCVMVQLRETEIDELIRRKLLEADARNDTYASVTIPMPSAMPCTLISITHCVQRSDAQQDNEARFAENACAEPIYPENIARNNKLLGHALIPK